jgi:hypothetical protein
MILIASSFFNALRVNKARNLLCNGTFPDELSSVSSSACSSDAEAETDIEQAEMLISGAIFSSLLFFFPPSFSDAKIKEVQSRSVFSASALRPESYHLLL